MSANQPADVSALSGALGAPPSPWRYRWAVLTVLSTLVLIFIGALVTSKGAGLSVPDWPLSYGMLMPPMVGNVFYEHGHRMVATFVGFLTLVLAFWTARAEPRRSVRLLAWGALAAVVTQGLLGGLTVLLLLPAPVSIAHAFVAQTFLCLLIALTYSTSTEWASASEPIDDTARLRPVAVLTTVVLFLQLLLGAVVRHTGAGLAIPDFPLALGRIVPPLTPPPVIIHFVHRLGAVAVVVMSVALLARCRRTRDSRLVAPAWLLVALAALQVGLGAFTVLTAKAPYLTTAHVATGAALLGLAWFITLRTLRFYRSPSPSAAPSAVAPGASPAA